MDLVGKILDFRETEDCQTRGTAAGWRLDWRRFRRLGGGTLGGTPDRQLDATIMLQGTDGAAATHAKAASAAISCRIRRIRSRNC
ncbi:MAG: hypothetical protein ABI165_15490 [Bryobacteraceae bacterium]